MNIDEINGREEPRDGNSMGREVAMETVSESTSKSATAMKSSTKSIGGVAIETVSELTTSDPTTMKSYTDPNSVDSEKKRSWKRPKDKPMRPLSAYNMFFQNQRERILAGKTGDPTPEEIQASIIKMLTSKSRGPKRRQDRVSHGQISFGDLTRTIAAKWKTIDPKLKAIYNHYAAQEKARYKQEVVIWKEKKEREHDAALAARQSSLLTSSQTIDDPMDLSSSLESINSLRGDAHMQKNDDVVQLQQDILRQQMGFIDSNPEPARKSSLLSSSQTYSSLSSVTSLPETIGSWQRDSSRLIKDYCDSKLSVPLVPFVMPLILESSSSIKITVMPLTFQEIGEDGTPVGNSLSLENSNFLGSISKEKESLFRYMDDSNLDDSKPSATSPRIAKGIHASMSTHINHIYSLQLDRYCATQAGKAGSDIESFDFAPNDHMITFELSKSNSRGQVQNDGYIDFAVEIHTYKISVSRISGTRFAYGLGKGVRLDLTDKYFLIDRENNISQKLMPEGFPKVNVSVDSNSNARCVVVFRFHQFDSSVKLYYDPWFRFWDNRHGRFDVISDSHTDPLPVHFGNEWPVSIKDPIVVAVDKARRILYPTVNVEDLAYHLSFEQKNLMTLYGYEAKGGYPYVKDILDKTGSWKCENIFEVKITEVKPCKPVATIYDRWRSAVETVSGATADLEACEMVTIRAFDPLVENESIQHGYTGQLIAFEASTNCSKNKYQWEFGDGSKKKTLVGYNKAMHKFEEAGEYVVALTVYNKSRSVSKTVTATITVEDTKLKSMVNNWKVISFALATMGAVVNSWEDLSSYAMVH